MARTRKAMSTKEMDEMYYKLTHGSTMTSVAASLGRSVGTVSGAMTVLRHYISMISDGSVSTKENLRTNYLRAAKNAIAADRLSITKKVEKDLVFDTPSPEKVIVVDPLPSAPMVPQDHFTKLELAFSLFTDSVQACIKAEVKRQVGEVMRENEEMKAKLDEARLGNWTQALRKNFEG